ncbi:MAG: SGNH/GDSL hydrolase family protein [Nitrospirales bacterium]
MQRTKRSGQEHVILSVGLFLLIVSALCVTSVTLKISHWRIIGFEKECYSILTDIGFLSLIVGGMCVCAAIFLKHDSTKRIVHAAILNMSLFFGGIVVACIVLETFLYVKYHDVQIGGVVSPSRYTFYPKYYQLNANGFRDSNHLLHKPEGVNRMVFVGDSFTFGAGVKRVSDVYFKVLERALQKAYPEEVFESVSIAKKGWNTVQEFEAFKTQGVNFKPDLVVLGYVLNDAETQKIKARVSSEFHNDHLLPYPYGKFLYANSFTYFIIEQKVKAVSFLRDKSKEKQQYIREIFSGDNLKQHETILRDFLAFVQAQDMRILVVLFPDLRQIHDPDYPYTDIHQFVAQTVREAGAEFVDLFVPLQNSGITNVTVSEFDSHPNEDVHEIAGTELFHAIKDKRLLPKSISLVE